MILLIFGLMICRIFGFISCSIIFFILLVNMLDLKLFVKLRYICRLYDVVNVFFGFILSNVKDIYILKIRFF